jgi:uncharacterized protein
MTKEEILFRLREHKEELQRKFPITSVALFGSYARGDASPQSDVDILVELREPMGWDFVDVLEYLENILKETKIDLISKGGVRPRLWEYIKDDLIYV